MPCPGKIGQEGGNGRRGFRSKVQMQCPGEGCRSRDMGSKSHAPPPQGDCGRMTLHKASLCRGGWKKRRSQTTIKYKNRKTHIGRPPPHGAWWHSFFNRKNRAEGRRKQTQRQLTKPLNVTEPWRSENTAQQSTDSGVQDTTHSNKTFSNTSPTHPRSSGNPNTSTEFRAFTDSVQPEVQAPTHRSGLCRRSLLQLSLGLLQNLPSLSPFRCRSHLHFILISWSLIFFTFQSMILH